MAKNAHLTSSWIYDYHVVHQMVTNALPWTDIAQPISMKIILLDLPIEDATS